LLGAHHILHFSRIRVNLEFGKRTKAIAYTDDILIAVKAETVREAENCANRDN